MNRHRGGAKDIWRDGRRGSSVVGYGSRHERGAPRGAPPRLEAVPRAAPARRRVHGVRGGVDVARSRPRRAGVARRGDRGEADLCRRLRAGERDGPGPERPGDRVTEPDADPVVRVRALESGADDVVPRDVYPSCSPGSEHSSAAPCWVRRTSSSWPARGGPPRPAGPRQRDGRPALGREFELAAKLASDPTRVFTKTELLRDVWGIRATGIRTRTVDSHASRLRRKLEAAGVSDVVVNDWGWAIGCSLATPRPRHRRAAGLSAESD